MALSLAACGDGSKPTEAPTTTAAGNTTTEATVDATATDAAAAPEAGAGVANKDRLLVWFNRQPSSSTTRQFDMTALNFNRDTYYVGFDADQGAELQGTTVKDCIEKDINSINRNGDGIIDCVLAIGDIGRNDPITRTKGIRKALGATVEEDDNINSSPVGTNTDGTATIVQDSSIEVGGETYVVRELTSQEMENSVGAIWDAATAGNAIGTWPSSFSDQIDIVASNNDGMDMPMFSAWSEDNRVPIFGYGANSDAMAAVAEGYGGTISRHADAQAYLALRILHNALDGVDIDTGTSTAGGIGNVLSPGVRVYKVDERSYYALDVIITAESCTDFTDSIMVYAPASGQLDEATHAAKNVWLNIYNSTDNFLGSTYQSLPQKYNKLLNLKIGYIGGDGQTESNIINRLGDPSQHDASAINMVKADGAVSYASLLGQ